MHQIFNPIFNTKSLKIFVIAVRCDHFGAILAVRFSINRVQPSHSIHASILSKSLSISLPISLNFCLSLLGQSNKEEEEIRRILTVSLLLSSSSSLLLYISLSFSALL